MFSLQWVYRGVTPSKDKEDLYRLGFTEVTNNSQEQWLKITDIFFTGYMIITSDDPSNVTIFLTLGPR